MEVGEYDDLPPLPQFSPTTSPKRLRPHRIASSPAIVQSRVVNTPGPDQVISTLIDSLTAISQSARDQLRQEFQDPAPALEAFHEDDIEDDRPPSPGSFYAQSAVAPSTFSAPGFEDESDDDAAAAPVIPYSRAAPTPSKRRTKRLPSSQSINTMWSERGTSRRNSTQNVEPHDVSNDPGLASLEKGNGSFTSLAFSVLSTKNRSRRPSPERTPRNQSPQPRPSTDRTYSDSVAPRDRSLTESDNASFQSTEDFQTSSTLSPLHREKLGEHQIPSRQSSIRSAVRRDHHRHSTGSRDLKDLHIDKELMDSDNSTVRRIKELQEAKEKRQNEWRKESNSPSEISTKRHSAPSPKLRRSGTYQSSKLSVTEVLVESEHESPQLSAQIGAADLALMPALVARESNSPLTPIGGRSQSPAVPTPPPKPPVSVPTLSAPIPPRDRTTSTHHKRISMISTRESRTEDIRSVHDEVEAFLSASRLTQKLRHPRTGRTIAFSEVGDPKGFVVLCCVGMGMTRYVMSFYDELARTLKLRLITPDRPGVGESETVDERLNNPLTWVDDVAVICEALEITRFSLLAHSAGTIYALATALKMPQFVRGRIHLLAPWIPPSQMPKGATAGPDAQPFTNPPMSHRILSVLPTSMLKVANSRFLSATSASVDARPSTTKKNKHLDILESELRQTYAELNNSSFSLPPELDRSQMFRNVSNDGAAVRNSSSSVEPRTSATISSRPTSPRLTPDTRAALYNAQLTHRIWTLATLNANPAGDLMTCLERKKTIGFRYADITRSIVIQHGAKDTRVPLDNVKWLDSIMKRSELRILDNEGHSLMANASVMSSVLSEISREWDEWDKIARYKDKKKRETGSASASVHSSKR